MKSLRSSFLIAIAIVLIGCGGSASTPPPTATPVQPTATLAPTTVPPTAVPPTTAPTTVPPTAIPPTTAPTTAPTALPPTTAPTAAPPTAAPPTAPTAAEQPTTAGGQTLDLPKYIPADQWKDPTPGKFTKEDVDYIFPPGRGQDLVFRACTGCHNWVPLVIAGFDRGAWQQNKINHKERASGLSQEEFDYLYEYLIATWPPGRPVPDNIPQDLLDQWTSY